MTAEQLVQDLETRTHADRVRAMIEMGRRNDAESRSILTTQRAGSANVLT